MAECKVVDFTRQLNFIPEFKTISIDKKKLIQQCLITG
jgi:hypothetical protein